MTSERSRAIRYTIANCPPERRPKALWKDYFPDWAMPAQPYVLSMNAALLAEALAVLDEPIHEPNLGERVLESIHRFRWSVALMLESIADRVRP